MIVLSAMTINNWYNEPLNLNDIIAGGTLISLAIIFMLIYIVTSFVLYRESHVATGFRYLFSSSINNMFLLLNYALFPGMLILFKKQMPAFGRRLCQVYFDTMWFSMCYHTLLVAWTRYEAVCHPCQFRKQRNSTTYVLCLMCYVIAFIQSMIVYFQPWYVTFYYEASAYGMIAEDTDLYLGGGKSRFFIIFHLIIFVSTFSLYSCALFLLFKYSRQTRNNFMGRTLPSVTRSIRQSSVFASANLSMRAETKKRNSKAKLAILLLENLKILKNLNNKQN
uniref:7TM_GPCR_Srx domain-containing protein n=1 Tax=Elaeophora elaphi TaxID=1147741 RepID=A0A158Q877_9BILA